MTTTADTSIWIHDGSSSSFRCYDDDERDLAACVERQGEAWIWIVWQPGPGRAVDRGESETRSGAMTAADMALAKLGMEA